MYVAMCDTISSRFRRRRKFRAEWIDCFVDVLFYCVMFVDVYCY